MSYLADKLTHCQPCNIIYHIHVCSITNVSQMVEHAESQRIKTLQKRVPQA